jgi:acetylornithine/succinyldiaminopimelate/putrescine aminotransferase
MFICDEVQCGLGRTGKMFAFEHWGLDPDIVTMAKTLSGGFVPVGAIVTRRPIYQGVFSNMKRCVVHSSTFGRNNLAMACGLATLNVLREEKLIERSAERGEQLMTAIRELAKKHDMIKDVRGKGCMIAIEFQKPANFLLRAAWKIFDNVDKGLFPEMIVHGLMEKHRVLTQVAGHNMDVIKILPPYTIGDREIERFISALDNVLKDCGSPIGPMWTFGANLARHALAVKKST